MNLILQIIKDKVYDPCAYQITNYINESESKEYEACHFKLNAFHIICRNAKITPKKMGQFVTFWKRNATNQIEPFHASDNFDFYVVNVQADNQIGQFVFPKSILIKHGILSTDLKEGKRAFRVYPPWDLAKSKQAVKTQEWQLNYFYQMNHIQSFETVKLLYK